MFKNTEVESGFNFESAFGYAQSSKFVLETGYERARARDLPDLPNLTVILRLGLASREPRDANPPRLGDPVRRLAELLSPIRYADRGTVGGSKSGLAMICSLSAVVPTLTASSDESWPLLTK